MYVLASICESCKFVLALYPKLGIFKVQGAIG